MKGMSLVTPDFTNALSATAHELADHWLKQADGAASAGSGFSLWTSQQKCVFLVKKILINTFALFFKKKKS
jgi:hypothetical protein